MKTESDLLNEERKENVKRRDAEGLTDVIQGTSLAKPHQRKTFRTGGATGCEVWGSWTYKDKHVDMLIARCESAVFSLMICQSLNNTQTRLAKEEIE